MAERTARIKLVWDASQVKRTQKEIEGSFASVEKKAAGLKSALGAVFAFAGIGVAVRQFVQLADSFTNIQNRLRTVTNSTQELNQVTAALGSIANTTRQSFEGTVEIFARVGLASKDLGLSQGKLLQLTQSLNQAVLLSGASGEEARAGLVQLSQGLASGALRGDELRSVLEQLPVVADVIAKQMGVTRGELRELGAEGKITTDIVLQGFQNVRKELDEKTAKAIPTVGQAFEKLHTNLVGTVGEFNKASHATENLAIAIDKLAEALPTVGRFLTSMFQTPLAGLVGLEAAFKKLPQFFASTFEDAFGRVFNVTHERLNDIIKAFNAVGPALGSIARVPIIQFETVETKKSAEEAASDIAKAFKDAFNAALAPDEQKDVDLTKSKRRDKDAAFVAGFKGIGLIKDKTSDIPTDFFSGEEKVFGAVRLEVEKLNGEFSKTPDLVGAIDQSVTPLFQTLSNAAQTAENSFAEFFTNTKKTGKEAFKELADSILSDLSRILFKKGAAALLRGFGPDGGKLATQLFPGFAGGGSFVVGGSGGSDSQFVGMRLTPGERVTVQTPQQQAAAPVNVRVVNQLDPTLVLDALGTGAGERVVMNIIQRNPNTIKRYLG